ncbi:MAG: helix-turn-helix domain-containing protein, partial [Lachnospiraceae bacterium]|nr:helix-turn-helix domain-containing protein [Lachnospiraceae bacterium]
KPISEIASLVGYENQSKFTQAFKSITGKLPKDIRK